jgi:hypothetical protein
MNSEVKVCVVDGCDLMILKAFIGTTPLFVKGFDCEAPSNML